MFTKKSLIIGAVLILTMSWSGFIAASAHTNVPADQPVMGVPAIPPAQGSDGLLSFLDVSQYLKSHSFIGGPTTSGQAPTLQSLSLTDGANLKRIQHLLIPWIPDNKPVYLAQLLGPFTLVRHLEVPAMSLTLPSLDDLTNSEFLGKSLQGAAPVLNNLASLNNVLNPNIAGNEQPAPAMPSAGMPSTGETNAGSQPSLGTINNNQLSSNALGNLLQNVYEIFDAHTGNLLAWG